MKSIQLSDFWHPEMTHESKMRNFLVVLRVVCFQVLASSIKLALMRVGDSAHQQLSRCSSEVRPDMSTNPCKQAQIILLTSGGLARGIMSDASDSKR